MNRAGLVQDQPYIKLILIVCSVLSQSGLMTCLCSVFHIFLLNISVTSHIHKFKNIILYYEFILIVKMFLVKKCIHIHFEDVKLWFLKNVAIFVFYFYWLILLQFQDFLGH